MKIAVTDSLESLVWTYDESRLQNYLLHKSEHSFE